MSVDCKVGSWSSWGECSATCNGGTKARTREVVQEPERGGAACPDLEETVVCNADECTGILLKQSLDVKQGLMCQDDRKRH